MVYNTYINKGITEVVDRNGGGSSVQLTVIIIFIIQVSLFEK